MVVYSPKQQSITNIPGPIAAIAGQQRRLAATLITEHIMLQV